MLLLIRIRDNFDFEISYLLLVYAICISLNLFLPPLNLNFLFGFPLFLERQSLAELKKFPKSATAFFSNNNRDDEEDREGHITTHDQRLLLFRSHPLSPPP